MNELAKKLLKEIVIDLSPYKTFEELRIMSPGWSGHRDVNVLLQELNENWLLNQALTNTSVIKNPESQVAENLSFMKSDYLLTRLDLDVDDEQLRLMLKIADTLNRP